MEIKAGIVTLIVLCGAWQAHAQVNCTATGAGRFAEPTDATCQNYTLCVFNAVTATYTGYNYTCPTTSVFNPNTNQCTAPTNYVCTVPNTTTSSVCTADGFTADPASIDCSTYISCVLINGVYTETTMTCPAGFFYNPATTLCDSTYICTTTFTCTAAGRFANPADATCQSYYLCVLPANGTLIPYQYTCPTVSVFNPTAQVCTTSYICPTP